MTDLVVTPDNLPVAVALTGLARVLAMEPGGALFTVGKAALQAFLAGYRVESLEKYAEIAGVDLFGGGNVQAAFDAATDAMEAAGGFVCEVPGWIYFLYRLRIPNRGGFVCQSRAATLSQLAPADPTQPEVFISNKTKYDTGVVFTGFNLKGGWDYNQAPYRGAAFGEAEPETDPRRHQYPAEITNFFDPDEGCHVGQRAMQWHSAFNNEDIDPGTLKLDGSEFAPDDKSDDVFRDRSLVRGQNARFFIDDILVEGFGGDGMSIKGSGGSYFGRMMGFRLGGRGRSINGYDSKYGFQDWGDLGLEGEFRGPNASAVEDVPSKFWYPGGRHVAGHTAGIRWDRCSGVTFLGQVQDPVGDLMDLNEVTDCTFITLIGWQGQIADMDADIAGITWRGASKGNQVIARILNIEESHPNVARVMRVIEVEGRKPSNNQLMITHRGFPGDYGVFNEDLFPGVEPGVGFVGFINGSFLAPREFVAGVNGDGNFTVKNGNAGVGVIGRGENSLVQPGAAILIHQEAGSIVHYAGGVSTLGLAANDQLVTLGLPTKFKPYLVATVPDADLFENCTILVTNDVAGKPVLATSDGETWNRQYDNAPISVT